MMDVRRLEASLPVEGLGHPLYAFDTIGSTNDEAKALAEGGAPHGTLVVADEQFAGKGRLGRQWHTRSGSGLALSLVLRPGKVGPNDNTLTVLGALSVVEALGKRGLAAQIKWPNDVIVEQGKLAGVLVEASWQGNEIEFAIVGIGVNVQPDSIPQVDLGFPATSAESVLGKPVDREDLMLDILEQFGAWYRWRGTQQLLEAWQQRLAYRNRRVTVQGGGSEYVGRLRGLAADGKLILELDAGDVLTVSGGEITLRPIDSDLD